MYVLIEIKDPKSGQFLATEFESDEIQVVLYNLIKQDPAQVHNIDNSIFDKQSTINIPSDLETGYYVVRGQLVTDEDDDTVLGIQGRFVPPLSVYDETTTIDEEPEERGAPGVMYA